MIPLLAVGSARGEVQVDDAWNLPGHPFPFTSPSHLAIPSRYSQRPHHQTLYHLAITLAIPSDLGILSAMSSHPQRPQRSWHPQRPQRSRHPQRHVFASSASPAILASSTSPAISASSAPCLRVLSVPSDLDILSALSSHGLISLGVASLGLVPSALARGFAAAWHRLTWHRLLLLVASLRHGIA